MCVYLQRSYFLQDGTNEKKGRGLFIFGTLRRWTDHQVNRRCLPTLSGSSTKATFKEALPSRTQAHLLHALYYKFLSNRGTSSCDLDMGWSSDWLDFSTTAIKQYDLFPSKRAVRHGAAWKKTLIRSLRNKNWDKSASLRSGQCFSIRGPFAICRRPILSPVEISAIFF